MKGAVLDYITSLLDRITVTTRLFYKTRYELADLNDDDLVTKYLLLNNSSSIPDPVVNAITGGTTPNPITVPYTGMVYPTLIFRNADGSNYGGAVNNVDNGSSIVLTGDDDGAGHFADSFQFIIKA